MARVINAAALREIRALVGISTTELARRCGIHRATITNIELGNHGVTPTVMRKLADALCVSIDAISSPAPEKEPAEAAAQQDTA
jgi:transcriptional regulator with XRE-family HTH domain